MTRSQLQSAVVQYTVLVALDMILVHEIGRDAYDAVWEDPVLKNLTATMNNFTPNTTVPTNSTSGMDSAGSSSKIAESFYLKSLPRHVFVHALLFPLAYYWQVFLERFFPARPRGVKIIYDEKSEKVEVDGNEDREEEIVKRWVAQGKVRRSSVSWWNTFVKWILDLTVGSLLLHSLWHLVDGCVRWRSFAEIFGDLKSVCSKSVSFLLKSYHFWAPRSF